MINLIMLHKYKQVVLAHLMEHQPSTKDELNNAIVQQFGDCDNLMLIEAIFQLKYTKNISDYHHGHESNPFYTLIDYVQPEDRNILYRDFIIEYLLEFSEEMSYSLKLACKEELGTMFDDTIYIQVVEHLITNGFVRKEVVEHSIGIYKYSIASIEEEETDG